MRAIAAALLAFTFAVGALVVSLDSADRARTTAEMIAEQSFWATYQRGYSNAMQDIEVPHGDYTGAERAAYSVGYIEAMPIGYRNGEVITRRTLMLYGIPAERDHIKNPILGAPPIENVREWAEYYRLLEATE